VGGEQQNKVEIVIDVTGGPKAQREFAAVKSGLTSVNTEAQKTGQALVSGLAPVGSAISGSTVQLKQAEKQLNSFGNTLRGVGTASGLGVGLAGLRSMSAGARQDLEKLSTSTAQLRSQSGVTGSALKGFGVAALAATGPLAIGILGVTGAFEALSQGVEFLVDHTTGLAGVTKSALAITNDDIRLRMDSVAAIQAQAEALETQGSAIGVNTERLRSNLTAQQEILAFDLGTRIQGIGQAFTRQNENLQRFRAVNEPTQIFQALGPALIPIIGQGGFTEIDFILSKTREFFGGKADDAGQAMRKLAIETIPLFVSQGLTMEQGLERIRQQFHLAPNEVNAFKQALEQLGGVSQLSLPTLAGNLKQAQQFGELQKRSPKFANQFGHLFQPEFLAREKLEDALVDAGKHPAGEAGKASILAALAALVGKENEHAQRAEQMLRERKAIDDRIRALTQKSFSGLTGKFFGIDTDLQQILGREHITSNQTSQARLAAGSAKNAALEEFVASHTKEVSNGLSQRDIDAGLAELSKRFLDDLANQQRAQNEIGKLNGEIRVANSTSEVDRIIAQHKLEAEAFEQTELFKTAKHEQQSLLRGKFEELFQAQQAQRRRDRLRGLDDEIAILQAEVSGRTKQKSEFLQLFARQKKERERVIGGREEIDRIQVKQGLEVVALQQRQYDTMFDTVKNRAEGVFDAIFTRGKKGFAGLLDYIKGIFITDLKDLFGSLTAELFLGRRPGGSAQGGGMFSGLLGLLSRGGNGIGGAEGILGAFGIHRKASTEGAAEIAKAVKSGVGEATHAAAAASCSCFEHGLQSLARTPAAAGGSLIPGLAGLGGLGSLIGFGGKAASAAPVGQATVSMMSEYGAVGGVNAIGGGAGGLAGLGSGGATLTPGVAGALPTTFANTALLTPGTAAGGTAAGGGGGGGLAGFAGSGLGSALIGGGAGFGGGFGLGKLLGIGGKRSAIAGGVGAAAGVIASAFLGPIGGALVGAGVGALTAGILRIFGGQTREIKLQKEIQRDFAIMVQDGKILKQIKRLGDSAFGRDADKKRFETLRMESVQSLLLNYAQQTGQDPKLLPLYQRFYGSGLAPKSISFDPSRGIPAFGSGGVVTRPTIALVGEHGPEAIVPLGKGAGGAVFNIATSVDARGATDPAAVGKAVQKAVESAVEKIFESGKIGAKRIDRAVVNLVNRGLSGDHGRRDMLENMIGT